MFVLKDGADTRRLMVTAAPVALALALLVLPRSASAQIAITGTAPPETGVAAPQSSSIVVNGQRLSTETSIADKKQAIGVIDLLTSDDLGKLPDSSVADSLSRIPGVSTIVNQDTGEGQFVTIRGLSGTYNEYTINGVRMAETDPATRDVSLNLLPPNGLAAVTVAKTLTPDMDGDGIAGAIDFRTPTAFDFKKDTVLRLYAGGGYNDRAMSAGEASIAGQGQADFAHKFDDGRIGIYVSADWAVSHGEGQEVENDGEWQPYNWKANNDVPVAYNTLQLPGIDLDYRRLKQTRIGGNFSFDYHGDTTQLYLRGQYAQLKLRGTNDTTEYNAQDDTPRLTQVNPNANNLGQPSQSITGTTTIGGVSYPVYNYTTSQIVDADGDGRITGHDAVAGGQTGYWSLNGASGVWDPQSFLFGREDEVIDNNQYLGTIDAGGHSDLGRLHLDYDASVSIGKQTSPDDYSLEYDAEFPGSLTWQSSDPRFPHPQTSAANNQVQYNPSLLFPDGAELEKTYVKDTRIAFKLDARYDFGGILDYIKFGGKYTQSKRHYNDQVLFDGDLPAPYNTDLADSGLIQKTVNSTLEGRYYYGAVYSRQAVEQAINSAIAAQGGPNSDPEDLYGQEQWNTEKIYAGYALANFKPADGVTVVAGGRFEHRDTFNKYFENQPDGSLALTSNSRSYSVFLPSITAIWRPTDKQVYRAAVWTGYAAPEFGYLTGASTITYAANGQVLSISQGNPNLKATRSTNFDVSAEYYPDKSSMISLAGFYKKMRHFIFTNDDSVDADTNSGNIDISQPQNGKDAHIAGIEFDVIKSFQGLEAPFDGFGVEANVTAQHARGQSGNPDYPLWMPLVDTPSLLYNLALTYQKYGIEGKLSYSFRDKYIEQLRDNGIAKWVQHNDSLDLHLRYNINKHFALDFDVSNLLNGWKYYTTRGPDPSYQKDYMEPGRNFLWRLSYVL
jgi:TonB-dependent receptor